MVEFLYRRKLLVAVVILVELVASLAAEDGRDFAKRMLDNIFSSEFTCHNVLDAADTNEDGRIDQTEYLGMVKEHSSLHFANITSFDDLPVSVQSTYVSLACLCHIIEMDSTDYGSYDCCADDEAFLVAPRHYHNESDTTNEHSWYFHEVCNSTLETVAAVITSAPSLRPNSVITSSPSSEPTSITRASAPHDGIMMGPKLPPNIKDLATNESSIISASAQANETSINSIVPDNSFSLGNVKENGKEAATTQTKRPWHPKDNLVYFIPFVVLSSICILAFGSTLFLIMRKRRQERKRDKNGFLIGSFDASLAQVTSALTGEWSSNSNNDIVSTPLEEQGEICGLSREEYYSYSGYESDANSSRISLRSIHIPNFLFKAKPYSHYKYPHKYSPHYDEDELSDPDCISPVTSIHGSENGSIVGTPTRFIKNFGGDHCTM